MQQTSKEFSIRPAAASDARAVRMLLPEIGATAAVFVAVDAEHSLIIGAASAARLFRTAPIVGPGIALHVIEPWRQCGVGTALLRDLETEVERSGAKALYGAKRVERPSQEFDSWERLGFEPCETVEEHILPIDQFAARLVPLVDRLRSRIPAGARVIPLYQADRDRVLAFHLAQMGGDRSELARKLAGHGAGAFLPRQSRVLLVNDQVKGCLLASRHSKETIAIDANIVEPGLRGNWANAWMKLDAFQGAPPGVIQFSFTTFDHYTDTRSFTKKLGGRTVRTTVLMHRPIAGRTPVRQE